MQWRDGEVLYGLWTLWVPSVAFRVGSGASRVTTDIEHRPSYSAGARRSKRSTTNRQELPRHESYGNIPPCPYGRPPTRCSSTCSDVDFLFVSEQAPTLKGLSLHETVPPSGNPEDGTNHDQVVAPELTLIEEHRSSYLTSAAKRNEPECTIVNTTNRNLSVVARVISPGAQVPI